MRNCGSLIVAIAALSSCGSACPKGPFVTPAASAVRTESGATDESDREWKIRWLYRDGLQPGWLDDGYAPRDLSRGKDAAVDFSRQGGWILRSTDPVNAAEALVFDVELGDDNPSFLEIQLRNRQSHRFPVVGNLETGAGIAQTPGWKTILVSMAKLNPNALPWDRLVIRASARNSLHWVRLNRIGLLVSKSAGHDKNQLESSSPEKRGEAILAVQKQGAVERPVRVQEYEVDCRAAGIPISNGIYGISYSPRHSDRDQYVWELHPSGRRWGGNPAERFNWKKGNIWNTGADWYFQNVNYFSRRERTWKDFLRENQHHGVETALTLPMLGWVARDDHSYSFPVSLFGSQQAVDPQRPDVGNGKNASGAEIAPLSPLRTSERVGPSFVAEWVQEINELARKGDGHVSTYMLGNEPMLWNSTHRDVHPNPVGYDEILERSLNYIRAVRNIDKNAYIAAPGLWGWPAYFYSAKDAAAGFQRRPDRRAHGDVPFLQWYLAQIHARARESGIEMLNALDVHFYPEGGVYSSAADRHTAALRMRSVRSLWDGNYREESWIREPIELLPRMRKMIDRAYPGIDLVIGEYSFGGEEHMSGAIALVDALGRFAENRVKQAYYWTYPKRGTPAYWAFRAFRNFDGNGGRFGTTLLLAEGDDTHSLYVSSSPERQGLVVVAANKGFDEPLQLRLRLRGCSTKGDAVLWRMDAQSNGLQKGDQRQVGPPYDIDLPPLSVATLAVQ